MTLRGLFFTLGVLAAFLLVFVPLARWLRGGTEQRIDADRMRRVFMALSLYEMSNDGLPAPNLGLVRQDVEAVDFQSVDDPEAGKANANQTFPLDPALPNLPLTSPIRVSWTYRWHWPNAGDPRAVRMDPRKGLLASWWSGPVLRVNTGGALIRAPRTETSRLIFSDLFGK
jgi:hypothetical protein